MAEDDNRPRIDGGIHEYLDWSRALLYGLALACLVLNRQDLSWPTLLRLLAILSFLTLDGWARYGHRLRLLKLTKDTGDPRLIKWLTWMIPVLFAFEITGLFFFASWALQFMGGRPAEGKEYLAVFAFLCAVHNLVEICLWPSEQVRCLRYLGGVVTEDATEITDSEDWRQAIEAWLSQCSTRISQQIKEKDVVGGAKYLQAGRRNRAVTHLLLQLCVIHIFYLNLLLSAYLALASYYGLSEFRAAGPLVNRWADVDFRWHGFLGIGLLVLVLAYFAYKATSRLEMSRLQVETGDYSAQPLGSAHGKASDRERCWQIVANVLLIIALLLLIAFFQVRWLPYVTLGVQGIVMIVMLVGFIYSQADRWAQQLVTPPLSGSRPAPPDPTSPSDGGAKLHTACAASLVSAEPRVEPEAPTP